MFNLTDYIKRNLINGFADGTWTESKVAQLAVGYYQKELLTQEDIAEIDGEIQTIKDRKEEVIEEEIVEDTDVADDSDFVDDSGVDGE